MTSPKPDPALTRRTFTAHDGQRLQCVHADRTEYHEEASGLRLRVSRSGARSWLVCYWSASAKTQRRLKLGDASNVSIARARTLARAALTAVDEGRDPYAERSVKVEEDRERRRQKAEERSRARAVRAHPAPTVSEVCRAYVEHRRTMASGRFGRPARSQTVYLWESMLRLHVVPSIGPLKIDRVTPEDVLGALEGAVRRSGPTMGPRVRDFLSAVWRWAERRPKLLGAAVAPIAFSALEKVGTVQAERERVLSPAEVWSFWRATETEGLQGEALRFSLLTAARVKEAQRVPWVEIDLSRKVWTLPASRSKVARDRIIPLSAQAIELLRRVQGKSANEYIFGSHRLNEYAIARIRSSMDTKHWEPRDLRRTAATLCARLGADPFTVALVLGHTRPDERMPAVTRTYLRWNYADKLCEALDRLGAWIEDTVTRATEPGDVVSIEARR